MQVPTLERLTGVRTGKSFYLLAETFGSKQVLERANRWAKIGVRTVLEQCSYEHMNQHFNGSTADALFAALETAFRGEVSAQS